MASQAQYLANQKNAQLSTGPVTRQGRARSSQNARKHGLTSRDMVIPDDQREAFASLQADLTAQMDPQGALEQIVFNQLLHAAWNQQRIRRLEAELCDGKTDPMADPAHTISLDRYARYQARADRAFHRALRELKVLQTERALRSTLAEGTEEMLPPLASIAQVAKRSRTAVDQEFAIMARSLRREQHYFEAVASGAVALPQSQTARG